jgi:ABC-2 type transport system ATP-binding protein
VKDVLELTDLVHKTDAEVNGLSRGMQQRLSIARVLLHDPKVLLLDEPASGLDPRARIEIRELLKELRRMGKTILISSHILHELAELCTSVGIVEKGKLVYSGPVREIMAKASRGPVVQIEVADRVAEAAQLLRGVRGIVQVDVLEADPAADRAARIDAMLDPRGGLDVSDLPNRLVVAGFRLRSMQMESVNLETAFMRLTRGIVS